MFAAPKKPNKNKKTKTKRGYVFSFKKTHIIFIMNIKKNILYIIGHKL